MHSSLDIVPCSVYYMLIFMFVKLIFSNGYRNKKNYEHFLCNLIKSFDRVSNCKLGLECNHFLISYLHHESRQWRENAKFRWRSKCSGILLKLCANIWKFLVLVLALGQIHSDTSSLQTRGICRGGQGQLADLVEKEIGLIIESDIHLIPLGLGCAHIGGYCLNGIG